MNYLSIVAVALIVVVIVTEFILNIVDSNAESGLSGGLISAGITLIVSSFPSTLDSLINLFGFSLAGELSEQKVNNWSIGVGFVLVAIGIWCLFYIRDRIYVLNIFGLFIQPEVSEEQNIKNLKLVDFKVKEIIIDFVDIFKSQNKLTKKTNDIIVNKIKKDCEKFKNRSNGFANCYTGTAPIPYTILAGTYLADSHIERYFENDKRINKLVELNKKKRGYPELKQELPDNRTADSREIVVAVSITQTIQDSDIEQFKNMDVVRLYLDIPKDGAIESLNQLNDYKDKMINCIETLKNEYSKVETIYLIASMQSCLSVEIGKMISLKNNRIPKIISCHYIRSNTPKYPFGIVVSDNTASSEKGKLIIFEEVQNV